MPSQTHFLQMFHYVWNYKMVFQPKVSNFLAGVMRVGIYMHLRGETSDLQASV